MEFYKIKNPSTRQIFEAIKNEEYTPLDRIAPKAKQLNILLRDYFNTTEVLVTFTNVTNTGGVPIFFGAGESIEDLLDHQYLFEIDQEDREHEIELLSSYTRTFKELFNI